MSQIKFNVEFEGKKAEVMTGWDPPLGYYHLTIFDTDPEAEDEILWDGENAGRLGHRSAAGSTFTHRPQRRQRRVQARRQ
jgi:hypothetical protein